MADQMVKMGQEWLNKTYGGKSGYNIISAESIGNTNWTTMYALTRALQIELGIASPSDGFGPTTLKTLESKYPKIEQASKNVPLNIIKIIQTGLYCKGYNGGVIDGKIDQPTFQAINSMRTNMGIGNGAITPKVFKALLTMDAYVLLSSYGAQEQIRLIQQSFNNKYGNRADYFYMPCDGIYSRDTQKALVFAIQYEGGMADGVANGNFGPGTQNIIKKNTINIGTNNIYVYLFKAAMIFNGFSCELSSTFTKADSEVLKKFQSFYMLNVTGIGNFETWASLLVSTGDVTRKGKACDCITEITDIRAKSLKAAGYETVGRYLTNVEGTALNKKIQPNELNTIFKNGLSIFPIYQTWGGEKKYFNYNQGKLDGDKAYVAARDIYGFNKGTTIYFAVDYDAFGEDIVNNIIPHFKGIMDSLSELGGYYSVGIYGPRNVCIKVSEAMPIKSSFVSSMSTGFSGNLGFPLPYNWAFDQISTITVGSGIGSIEIDNNIKSGRDLGQTSVNTVNSYTPDVNLIIDSHLKLQSSVLEFLNREMSSFQKDKALISREDAIKFVLSHDKLITRVCQKYNIRKALLQTVFQFEYALIGIDDAGADGLVMDYHKNRPGSEVVDNIPIINKFYKGDSSTGCCQMFASTTINAMNYAIDRTIYSGVRYNVKSANDIYTVWKLLQSNQFSIEKCALVLLHAAETVGVPVSLNNNYIYDTNQIKKILARYNGTGTEAKLYGEKVYKLYVIFEAENEKLRKLRK